MNLKSMTSSIVKQKLLLTLVCCFTMLQIPVLSFLALSGLVSLKVLEQVQIDCIKFKGPDHGLTTPFWSSYSKKGWLNRGRDP